MARDPTGDLIEFLQLNLDSTRLSFPFDPAADIDYPDYEGSMRHPSIRPATKDTTVPGGGVTGYSGMDPGGGGGTQNAVATIQVDGWGGSTNNDRLQDVNTHPATAATELAEAVHATVMNNQRALADYDWIGAEPPVEAHDDTQSSMLYREYVVVGMGYFAAPE